MRVLGAGLGIILISSRYALAQSRTPSASFEIDAVKETDGADNTKAVSPEHATTENETPPEPTFRSSSHSIHILPPPTRSHSRSKTLGFSGVHTGTRTFPITHHPPSPTQTGPFNIPNTVPSAPGQPSAPSHRQTPVAIVFECIAGVVGLIFVVWLSRCLYQYKRIPRQDRIASLLERHQLDREMEELEREQIVRRARRTSLFRPPPPPYQHAPPAYDAVVGSADEHV